MSWIQTADPAALAINLADLKGHLRLTSSDEDTLLELYAKAAIDVVERKTRRALISRTFRYEAWAFPVNEVVLPLAPLVSVQNVRYYDTTGTLSTWDSAAYTVDATSILGKVVPALGQIFPPYQFNRPDAVQVNFTAGYGSGYQSVPAGLRLVVMFLAGHYFVNRAPVMAGLSAAAVEIPKTLDYAIDAYRIWSA